LYLISNTKYFRLNNKKRKRKEEEKRRIRGKKLDL
jgi:hypothetical protein